MGQAWTTAACRPATDGLIDNEINIDNDVARTLKKLRTSDISSDSLQLRPFSSGTSLKGKNLLPEGANSFL